MSETSRAELPPHRELAQARERFLALVADLRPELHRYCARLTGSVVDGEDVVQEALAKALYALSMTQEPPPLRPWLFRIAHNTALDHLRRYEARHATPLDDDGELPAAAAVEEDAHETVHLALARFLELPVSQRGAVILKDVLGHSLEEVAATLGTSVQAVKALLFRGRTTLRAGPPALERVPGSTEERSLLARYAALFNARDWDGLRSLLAEEVRLDLVSKAARRGREVHQYFSQYAALPELRMELGEVEGRPALLVLRGEEPRPAYFVLVDWAEGRVTALKDFRYVPYIMRDVDQQLAGAAKGQG